MKRAEATPVHGYLVVPEADRVLSPILAMDPDFPRNLSKTLTVD